MIVIVSASPSESEAVNAVELEVPASAIVNSASLTVGASLTAVIVTVITASVESRPPSDSFALTLMVSEVVSEPL